MHLGGGNAGSGATVLVVDDDPFNRRMLVRALEHEGHQTVEANDGVEGLKLLQELEPDTSWSAAKTPNSSRSSSARSSRISRASSQ